MWGAVRFGMNVHVVRKFWPSSEVWTKRIKDGLLSKKRRSEEEKEPGRRRSMNTFDKEHP